MKFWIPMTLVLIVLIGTLLMVFPDLPSQRDEALNFFMGR